MAHFFVENFGCRATQADGAAIVRQMRQRGLSPARNAGEAQVVVLNSCTVTAAADADLRSAVRRVHRQNPACKILVTGCYAQRAPQEVAALPGVTWVVGNSHKSLAAEIACSGIGVESRLADLPAEQGSPAVQPPNFISLDQLSGDASSQSATGEGSLLVGDIFAHTQLMAAPVFDEFDSGKTRPNLKVQDGCGNRCSFCVIPFVRGNSRSLRLQEVIGECRSLVAAGYREVVISGINLGRWGRDLAEPQRFVHLVRAILDETSLPRLRISSVEPMDWTDELIEVLAASPRIARHAHVPLQSGSDTVLRRMHRKYRPWHYAERVRKIREAMPDAAIGADVMAGFPGETEAEFEENRRFIEELPLTYLHVFSYSSRPGTAAAAMPGHVPAKVIQERNRVLRALGEEKNLRFREGFQGKKLEAITLHERDASGNCEALTSNFLKLQLQGAHAANQLIQAHIHSLTPAGLAGSLV